MSILIYKFNKMIKREIGDTKTKCKLKFIFSSLAVSQLRSSFIKDRERSVRSGEYNQRGRLVDVSLIVDVVVGLSVRPFGVAGLALVCYLQSG